MKHIVMPAAGQTTNIATVTRIIASIGDKVKRGAVLMEVETDKTTLPIESYAAGYICGIYVKEFDTVDAGVLLMDIGTEKELEAIRNGETANAEQEAPAPLEVKETALIAEEDEDDFAPILPKLAEESSPAPTPASVQESGKTYPAMPNAKKLAKERGVSLSGVMPANGLFLKKTDVPTEAASAPALALAPIVAQAAPASPETDAYEVLPIADQKRGLMRKLEQTTGVPTFSLSVTADLSAYRALAEAANGEVTLASVLLTAIQKVSLRYPLFAARYMQNELRVYSEQVAGLALDGPNGTVSLPLHTMSGLSALKQEIEARTAQVNLGDLSATGAASTLLSDGSAYSVDAFAPGLTLPGLTAIGIGKETVVPVWKDGAYQPTPAVTVTGVFDSRFYEPAVAASALGYLKSFVETPALLLL